MKVTKTTVEKILITDAKRSEGLGSLDPISVILEDFGSGAGQITISCYGDSWTQYWSHMGKDKILVEFFCQCNTDYIVGKLKSGIRHEIDCDDPEELEKLLKRKIIEDRRSGRLLSGLARELYDAVIIYDRNYDGTNILYEILGDEWWLCTPKRPNPDYIYLSEIVEAVKLALKEI